jgi:hypothetical protein
MGLGVTKVPGTETFLPGLSVCMWDLAFDDSYSTGGEVLDPAAVGAGGQTIRGVQIVGYDAEAAPYNIRWNKDSGKLMVFRTPGFTPAGTNGTSAVTGTAAAQTFTGTPVQPSFTVQSAGAIGSNMEVGLSADSAAATFEGGTGITAARTLTSTSPVGSITPAGTNGASASLSATAAAQTFTGTAVAEAAFAEVDASTNLSTLTVRALVYSS